MNNKGQSLVFFILLLPIIFLIIGMLFDLSKVLNEKLKKEKEEPLKKTRAKAKKSTMEKATERVITNTASSFGRKLGNSLFKNLFK